MIKKDLRKHRTFRLTDEEFEDVKWVSEELIKVYGKKPSHGQTIALAMTKLRMDLDPKWNVDRTV